VQARALNLLAYINRAQVGHQVAMAHLVTLATWAQFGQHERQRLLRGNPPGVLIGMLFGARHGKAYASAAAGRDMAAVRHDIARAYARHDEVVHHVLAQAARLTLADLPTSRQQAMQAVVRANYPDFEPPTVVARTLAHTDRFSMGILEDGWSGFVQRYAGHASDSFKSLVLSASHRYGFLAPRQGTVRNPWPVSFRCPTWRHELRRGGHTLLNSTGRWAAVDTQSFHKLRSNKYIGCYYREYAMGWGKATGHRHSTVEDVSDSQVRPPDNFSQQHFWRWVQQHTSWDIVHGSSNQLASAYAMQSSTRWRGRGMPFYVDVPQQQAHRTARLVVILRQPATLLSTLDARSTVAAPIKRFSYRGLQAHEQLAAVSAAEAYFERPSPRADGNVEIATLFRPYWQARLTSVPVSYQRGGSSGRGGYGD
jgi:hypothetical protein